MRLHCICCICHACNGRDAASSALTHLHDTGRLCHGVTSLKSICALSLIVRHCMNACPSDAEHRDADAGVARSRAAQRRVLGHPFSVALPGQTRLFSDRPGLISHPSLKKTSPRLRRGPAGRARFELEKTSLSDGRRLAGAHPRVGALLGGQLHCALESPTLNPVPLAAERARSAARAPRPPRRQRLRAPGKFSGKSIHASTLLHQSSAYVACAFWLCHYDNRTSGGTGRAAPAAARPLHERGARVAGWKAAIQRRCPARGHQAVLGAVLIPPPL